MDILRRQGETNQAIALRLGITEGAVRYHLKRLAQKGKDGRAKLSLIEQLELVEAVDHWWKEQLELLPKDRAPNVKELWTFLSDNYHYIGTYKSVQKYVQKRFPKPPKRPFRRVETPAAAQTQSDWMDVPIRLRTEQGVELVTLYGFVMTLSHSRKFAVIWSSRMDQLAWHRVHNEAFKRLGGIAAVNRIDNLKTGVARGSGVWGEINEAYSAYARTMGFHVDPHQVRYAHKTGEVRGCAHIIQVVDPRTGEIVHELPRNTRGLVQIDQACYEPTDAERLDDSIPKPLPLGAMAKRIEELASTGAPCRSIDFYESLAALKAASHK